jgi:uncharacterized protein (TIGR00369 family)
MAGGPAAAGHDRAVALHRTADQLVSELHNAFPPQDPSAATVVEHLGETDIRLRMPAAGRQLRPGGTVSGPTQFALADLVAWLMTLAHLEPGRDAVTAGITMQFLRRPQPAALVGEGRLLKLGRRFSVTDVLLYSDGAQEPVAQATVTYAPI